LASPVLNQMMQDGVATPLAPRKTAFEHTADAPEVKDQQQVTQVSGLTDEEQQRIVKEIIHPYRTQWSTDRILRMPEWLKYTEFDKGNQILEWDPQTRNWFDAVAWARQQNQETDYTRLERYLNNITQKIRKTFTTAVARAVPPIVIQPENAENLADLTTAKAAQEAVTIIEKFNNAKNALSLEAKTLFLYGVYFKWTRFCIDGAWAGYKEEPEYGDVQAQLSVDHFHCTSCGADTDASDVDISDPDNMECGNCGGKVGPQDFYPGESTTVPGITGKKKKPNGMVKWSIHSPLQVDTDPAAETIADCDLLALEYETNVAQLRDKFPGRAEEIKEGTESATNDNATYDRLVRSQTFSRGYVVTADIFTSRTTFTQVWLQPAAYSRSEDQEFVKKLKSLYPYGMKMSMNGMLVLDLKPAVMEKEWTACKLDDGYGMYPPSVAKNVVPFNERFNNINNILDDYMERCATGVTMIDPKRIDYTELSGKSLTGGNFIPVPSLGEGIAQPLENAIKHFAFQLDPGLFNYLDRLWNYCMLIANVPPQVGGTGTQEGVETAKGQAQMLDQALGVLGEIYDRIKTEHAEAGQNAIECLQQNMSYTGDLWSVIEENGSEFRNNYVHLDEMQGRVRVSPNTDEGLPMSPEQKRAWCEEMMKMAQEENSAALAWLDETTNQELLADYWGLPGSVIPGAAQRSKTLQDINKLLQARAVPMQGPQGPVLDDDGTPKMQPSFAPEKWVEDYAVLKKTVMEFCAENCDVKAQNPTGWQNLIAFFRLACQYEMEVEMDQQKKKVAIQSAGAPQGPQSNPQVQQIEAEGLKQAMGAVDRLAEQGSMPPLAMGQSISGQVSANKELVDSVAKLLKEQ
jgi:hypothetical protein